MELVIALLVVGAILILAETILPGMVAGILGACCVVAGLITAYARLPVSTANQILLGTIIASIILTILWFWYFPKSKFAQVFINKQVSGELGVENPSLLYQTGKAVSVLRPSGMAEINGHRVDVITEGEMIEPGTPIKVVAVEGMRVVVRSLAHESLQKS